MVPAAWIAALVAGAAFGWRGWRLPASRMWRRAPTAARAHSVGTLTRGRENIRDYIPLVKFYIQIQPPTYPIVFLHCILMHSSHC